MSESKAKTVIDVLKTRALNGNNDADKLFWEMKDMDDAEMALFIAENDSLVRDVVGVDNYAEFVEDSERAKNVVNEYGAMLNAGKMAYTGKTPVNVYGQNNKGLEDFGKAFGVVLDDDDKMAAFTNPDSPDYFGRKSATEKQIAAMQLGYPDVKTMESDIKRASDTWQRGNQLEGFDANHGLKPISFALSALKGYALPRVKEAQKNGREVTWRDVAGDMAELGLSFVPGVGIVGKAGKVIAKPFEKTAFKAFAPAIGSGIAGGLAGAAAPFGAEAADATLYGLLGQDSDKFNPRATFDASRAAQRATANAVINGSLGGIVGAKMRLGAQSAVGKVEGDAGAKVVQDELENIAAGKTIKSKLIGGGIASGVNAGVRETFPIDAKREAAIRNKMLTELRPLTANAAIPVEERKRNAQAVMNVLAYGLDGIPESEFVKNPAIYRLIADKLGIKNWKHESEVEQ